VDFKLNKLLTPDIVKNIQNCFCAAHCIDKGVSQCIYLIFSIADSSVFNLRGDTIVFSAHGTLES